MKSLVTAFMGAGVVITALYGLYGFTVLIGTALFFTVLSDLPQAFDDTEKGDSTANTDAQK